MKDITKSFAHLAIRNAIGGLLIIAIFIYSSVTDNQPMTVIFYFLAIVTGLWLFIGLDLRKKIKSFPDNHAYDNPLLVKWHKTIDRVLMVVLIIVIWFNIKKIFIPNFLLAILLTVYISWLIYKWTEIRKVFKSA